MYIVVIECWISSVSDAHVAIYLEMASSPEQAKQQARARLDYPEQVFEIETKEVSEANIGLVYISG